jgi:hypothetical protein
MNTVSLKSDNDGVVVFTSDLFKIKESNQDSFSP